MNKKTFEFFPLKRVNYVAGMLLTAEAFQVEEKYFRERMKLHNRFLHGYGIVTGLDVSVSAPDSVTVNAGYAIDLEGNDIILPTAMQGKLRITKSSVYLVLCFAERKTDLVPVPSNDSGENGQQPSRIEEYGRLAYESEKNKASQMGVILAQLKNSRGKWIVDKKFKPNKIAK